MKTQPSSNRTRVRPARWASVKRPTTFSIRKNHPQPAGTSTALRCSHYKAALNAQLVFSPKAEDSHVQTETHVTESARVERVWALRLSLRGPLASLEHHYPAPSPVYLSSASLPIIPLTKPPLSSFHRDSSPGPAWLPPNKKTAYWPGGCSPLALPCTLGNHSEGAKQRPPHFTQLLRPEPCQPAPGRSLAPKPTSVLSVHTP